MRYRPRPLKSDNYGATEVADQSGVGAGSSKGEADARRDLDDADAELQKPQAKGGELRDGERERPGNGITDGEHEPIGGGVQDQPHLVGERAAAAGAVGGELRFVQLDQVLGLAAGAVEGLIDMLGRAGVEARDDKANVEPLCRRLAAGTGAALPLPGLGLVAGLGEAAQGGLLVEGAAGAGVCRGPVGGPPPHRHGAAPRDENEAPFFAPSHAPPGERLWGAPAVTGVWAAGV